MDVIEFNPEDSLPQAAAEGRPAQSREVPLVTPRKRGILVVDDEGIVRSMLGVGLRQQGFAVWLAAGGQEALGLYRDHSQAIDVVLLDVRMPGLDGPQTLVALRQMKPQIRCCFMSGDLGSYGEERLGSLGAAFIRKPFGPARAAQVLWHLAPNDRSAPFRNDLSARS
jgi:CheY-like chemotaxis protein